MKIAVLTFEGFNELDSFIASGRINRVKQPRPGELRLDPSRQVIAAQCSGALVLAKLGLLAGVPACTDSMTRPWAVVHYVAPVGEKEEYVERARAAVREYLPAKAHAGA